jgi:glyoxylase-like metal-dependent hydrolase (beta-lactamase superfamily II)
MLKSDNQKTTRPTVVHLAVAGLASLLLFAWPVAVGVTAGAQQPAAPLAPMIRENATQKVAAHTWVIPDFDTAGVPNVGIIAGSRATLVIDTGMGPRNGEIVLRETMKVSRNAEMYLATTHIHPEHDLGAGAFPASTKMIRSRTQDRDIAESGLALAEQFSRNPVQAELLKGVQFRKADISFDGDYALDLGGVRVRMTAVGPTHTLGDTVFFVEGDRVLFSGDVVMSAFPAVNPPGAAPTSSVRTWLAALDRLDAFMPTLVVPSHRRMGDASMIAMYRDYFQTLQRRAAALKREGKTADETATLLQMEIASKYPDTVGSNRVGAAAGIAYAEAP